MASSVPQSGSEEGPIGRHAAVLLLKALTTQCLAPRRLAARRLDRRGVGRAGNRLQAEHRGFQELDLHSVG